MNYSYLLRLPVHVSLLTIYIFIPFCVEYIGLKTDIIFFINIIFGPGQILRLYKSQAAGTGEPSAGPSKNVFGTPGSWPFSRK